MSRECARCERESDTVVEDGGLCIVCESRIGEMIDQAGICGCDDPSVSRTIAEGTPAEENICDCGGVITNE